MTCEEPALVRSVEGVHEGVDTGAVSAVRDAEVLDLGGGLLVGEVGAVATSSKDAALAYVAVAGSDPTQRSWAPLLARSAHQA